MKLYSVSPGEAYSEPLEVKINPEEPPYITAYKEMEIKPDFAGIRIKTSNTSNETLTFYVYRKDATGKWTEAGALYTKKQEINEPIRGMEAVPSEFSVVVKDRWGHLSESKEISLTPYYEEEVDKKKWDTWLLANTKVIWHRMLIPQRICMTELLEAIILS